MYVLWVNFSTSHEFYFLSISSLFKISTFKILWFNIVNRAQTASLLHLRVLNILSAVFGSRIWNEALFQLIPLMQTFSFLPYPTLQANPQFILKLSKKIVTFWLNVRIITVIAKVCGLSSTLHIFFHVSFWCFKLNILKLQQVLPLNVAPCAPSSDTTTYKHYFCVWEIEFPQGPTKHLMKCEAQTFHYNILCTFAFNNYILHPRSLNSFQKWITVVLFSPEYSFFMTETALS